MTRIAVALLALIWVLAPRAIFASGPEDEGIFLGSGSARKWLMVLEDIEERAPPSTVSDRSWRSDWRWDRLDLELVRTNTLKAVLEVKAAETGKAELHCQVLESEAPEPTYPAFSFAAVRSADGQIESVKFAEGEAEDTLSVGAKISIAAYVLVFGAPTVWLIEGEEPGSIALRFGDLALDIWTDAPNGRIMEPAVQWPPPTYLYPTAVDAKGRLTFVGMNVMPRPRDWSFWRLVYDPRRGHVAEVERVRYHLFQKEVEDTALAEAEALLRGDAVLISRFTSRATITPLEDDDTASQAEDADVPEDN